MQTEPLHRALVPFEDYGPRLLTAADLAELPDELPSGSVRFELDNGVLMHLPLADFAHGCALGNVAGELREQGEKKGHGKLSGGGVGIILRRSPDRVVGADVAFISNLRLPVRLSREGYLETIPDLVVEVVSKNDTKKYIARKVADYLKAGVGIVWVVNPATRELVEHTAAGEVRVYDAEANVTLPNLIPGFSLKLNSLLG